MKILLFDDFKLGVLKGDAVVDVSSVVRDIPRMGPQDLMAGLIEHFADYRQRLDEAVAKGAGVPVSKVRIVDACELKTAERRFNHARGVTGNDGEFSDATAERSFRCYPHQWPSIDGGNKLVGLPHAL